MAEIHNSILFTAGQDARKIIKKETETREKEIQWNWEMLSRRRLEYLAFWGVPQEDIETCTMPALEQCLERLGYSPSKQSTELNQNAVQKFIRGNIPNDSEEFSPFFQTLSPHYRTGFCSMFERQDQPLQRSFRDAQMKYIRRILQDLPIDAPEYTPIYWRNFLERVQYLRCTLFLLNRENPDKYTSILFQKTMDVFFSSTAMTSTGIHNDLSLGLEHGFLTREQNIMKNKHLFALFGGNPSLRKAS